MNKGFTLVETLFVLIIICILMSVGMLLKIPRVSNNVEISNIVSFLNQAKLQAIVTKENTTISFHHNSITYDNHTYPLLDNYYFDEYQLSYNKMGHINKPKTVVLHTDNQDYSFVYQIGCGYFYVK